MAGYDGLNPDFAGEIQAMVNASGGKLTISSGYRSVDEQTQLWNAALAKYGSAQAAAKWVAYPGTSHHNLGIAVDLGGDLAWAHQHAGEFGLYFPMSWEPWHIEPLGGKGALGQQRPGQTAPPVQADRSLAHGLDVIGDMINTSAQARTQETASPVPTGTAAVPSAQTPSAPQATTPSQHIAGPQASSAPPQGQGGDNESQLEAGFRAAGRDDLAQMVRTPAFRTWINKESGWNAGVVSPANNQGMPNGGLFQFWAGHDWAKQYFQGGHFTASPFEQAYLAATHFNLTPDRIMKFASDIQAGDYVGWG